jgi:hypothetical protein
MATTLSYNDNRGGMAYPFLPADWHWTIVSHPLKDSDAVEALLDGIVATPTLRWVKDDKALDLRVPGLDTAAFLSQTGLQLSMAKGGYVLSKRVSRIMRPYRYWAFFDQADVRIDYNELLDGRLWDGCGLVSAAFVQRLADSLDLSNRHRQELLRSGRLEVTTLHKGGQDKGHVLVVDDLAVDFMFPAHSAKTELRLTPSADSGQADRVFVGLQPVHSSDAACLDIQSVINLHPFLKPEQLLHWMQLESALFLDSIRSGRVGRLLGRLTQAESAAEMDSFSQWHVGDYLLSGGQPLWFAGMVKGVAKQHLLRLGSREKKLRVPAPAGRYYIFPADVGQRQVAPGQIELDPANATAWVNDQDWLDYIVDVLGGCDGDDALWILPFTDYDGRKQILAWRSPNQLGEYVLLTPTANSHEVGWTTLAGSLTNPKLDSRLLPPRIDGVNYQYGFLAQTSDESQNAVDYSPAAMRLTICRAVNNAGVLGAHCNVLMLCKAIYGRLSTKLPATLEAVIDSSVKSGANLKPVKKWNKMAAQRMVAHGQRDGQYAIPVALVNRLPKWLFNSARRAKGHWLDSLVMAMEMHKAQYSAEVETLAAEACPPLVVFEQGRDWLHVGQELRQIYANIMRQTDRSAMAVAFDALADEADETADGAAADPQATNELFDRAAAACETFLQQWPADRRHLVLLGAMAYLYAEGPEKGEATRDAVLWQLGQQRQGELPGREPGLAQASLRALRRVGLLGEPAWTPQGALLRYQDAPQQAVGVPVTLNGVWFNLLRATDPHTPASMSQTPEPQRQAAKARIADYVADKFIGMKLTTAVTDSNRVITRTERGNLFGYVKRDHELAAVRHDQWQIAWAMAVDGNVRAILTPASVDAA